MALRSPNPGRSASLRMEGILPSLESSPLRIFSRKSSAVRSALPLVVCVLLSLTYLTSSLICLIVVDAEFERSICFSLIFKYW